MAQKSHTVTLELHHAGEILAVLYPNGRLGGVRVDGTAPAALGAKVELLVRVQKPSVRHITARMRIAWVRHRGNERLRECFGLDFLPADPGSKARLLAFARGQVDEPHLRSDQRFTVEW